MLVKLIDIYLNICLVLCKILIYRLSLNQSSSEATSFQYSDLIKVHSEIEDHLKMTSGINVSKLKLKAFEAPKIASINRSGTVSTFLKNFIFYFINSNNICFRFTFAHLV